MGNTYLSCENNCNYIGPPNTSFSNLFDEKTTDLDVSDDDRRFIHDHVEDVDDPVGGDDVTSDDAGFLHVVVEAKLELVVLPVDDVRYFNTDLI